LVHADWLSRFHSVALYLDVTPLAQALIAVAPDRRTWGSDWPHTNPAHISGYHLATCESSPGVNQLPNDGKLADALGEWLPDFEIRRRVLVDNPTRLYEFD
jgi:predicted TIM-barrel fold metal-dependent hydrolase